jgi:hypothetical protein
MSPLEPDEDIETLKRKYVKMSRLEPGEDIETLQRKCAKMSRLEPGEEPGPLIQVVVPPDRQLSHNHRQAEPSGHLHLTLCTLGRFCVPCRYVSDPSL